MKIVRLSSRPDLIPEIVKHLHAEWSAFTNWSNPEKIRQRFLKRSQPETGETCFVALGDEKKLLGTASVLQHEIKEIREGTHWMSEVYTCPDARGKGIGTALIEKCVDYCRAQNFKDIYLYTPDQQALYRKHGWRAVIFNRLDGEQVSIMKRTLA